MVHSSLSMLMRLCYNRSQRVRGAASHPFSLASTGRSDTLISHSRNDPVFSDLIRRVAPIGLVTLITFFALLMFQWAKHLILPDMTLWESHAITAAFACLVAALGTYL